MRLQIGDRPDPERIGDLFADEYPLAVVRLRIVEPCQLEILLVLRLHFVIHFVRVGDQVLLQNREEPRSRVFRVDVDLIAHNALVDEGRRNVEDPCHVVTRVFKRQRVQFGDDLIFREVLGADPDLPGVLPGALTAGGFLAAGPIAVAGSLAATSGKSGYGEN